MLLLLLLWLVVLDVLAEDGLLTDDVEDELNDDADDEVCVDADELDVDFDDDDV